MPPTLPASDAVCERLVCASHWTPPGSAIDHLLAGRAGQLARASGSGLRTAVLHAAGWLVRWVEGSADAMQAEWERLQAHPDLRHTMLLHRSLGPATLRGPVQVASLYAGEQGSTVARRLHWIAREREQGWHAEPEEVWQALCAPCQLASGTPVGFLGRREVLALASDDNEAVEVVRSLAQHHRADVAYQRYADGDTTRLDVGAAYTDVASGRAAVTRVHGLSRRALVSGATVLGLRHIDTLVLILGERDARNQAALAEVEQFLQGLPQRPLVQVVAHRGGALPLVLDLVGPPAQPPQAGAWAENPQWTDSGAQATA